jgi:MBG domain (YGX type)/Concanavalin A-like lectin/glucanases superfamily
MNSLVKFFTLKISKVLVFTLLGSFLTFTVGSIQAFEAAPAFAATGDSGSVLFNEPRTNYLKMDAVNSAFGFGTADFTIEFWWKPTQNRRSDTLDFYNQSATNMTRLDIGAGIGTGGIELYTDNGCSIGSNVSLSTVLNTWTHIALTRSSGTLYFWVNGVQKGTIACNKDFGSAGYSLSIMKDHGAGANGSGSLSNIRVVKGTAVYTSAFSVPTSDAANIAGTTFLLNTPQGANYLVDSSISNLTVTAVNNPVSDSSSPIPLSPPTIASVSISGTATLGQTLTASLGATTGNPSPTVTYAWRRGGVAISGATSSTYQLVAADVGAQISVVATVTSSQGTNSATSSSTAVVSKATPTFTWSGVSKTYGDPSFGFTAPTSSTPGTWTYSSGTPSVLSVSGSTATVAGYGSSIITATFTPSDTTSYISGGTTSMTVTVAKATPTFTWSGVSKTYGDPTFTLTAPTPSTPGTWTYSSGTASVISLSGSTATVAGYGSSVITATFTPTDTTNYVSGGTTTMTISVGKATPTFSWSPATKTFGDSSFTLTAPTSSTPGTWSYSSGNTSVITLSGATATVTGVGSSIITGNFTPTDATNFVSGGTTTMTVTVQQGPQPTTLAISSTTGTYGANVALTTTGGNGGGANSFVVDSGPCTIGGAGSTLISSGAGTCMVTATKAANGNYLATSSVSTAITIAKQTPTFTWSGVSKVYGDIFALTTPTSSTPGTWTYSSGTTSVVTLSGETATVVGNGSSLITATFTPTDTTNFVSSGTTTMTIAAAKAAITVTPTAGQSKVYGTSDPVLTYSITTGALVGSDQLVGSLTYTSAGQNTAVGSYSIISGTLTNANNSNYTITLGSVNFAITQATQAAVTLSSLSSAYNPSNKTVSLTGSGGTGSGTYSYAIDSSNTTTGCSISISTLTYTTAGTCIIAVTRSSDTNYLARTDSVSFSIGLASQTITFASLTAKSYSSDTFTVTASASSGLLVIFTSGSTSICTTSGVNGTVINLRDVGLCVINANQPGDANTAAAAQVVQSFTVNPRAITVTADPKSKVYGTTSDPVLSYSITTGSLVLGDSLSGALSRAAGTDVGTYLISAGTLTSANNPKYSITYVSDNLTITKATPTLVLTYPNSNIVILTPGITDTATVATSSSNGTLSFASPTSVSICSVDATSGVISFTAAGVCQIVMTSAATTNYLQASDTETVTSVLQSTSLAGIPSGNLIPMGGTFYASPILTQSVSATVGSNGASVSIPANALPSTTAISISLLTDATTQLALISGASSSVLSVVVSWVSPDGSVPQTSTGNPISVTLTNPSIKAGAKVYSVVGGASTLVGTATVDGSITSQITSDPVLVVVNPAIVIAPPVVTPPVVTSVPVDNSAAIAAAQALAAAQAAAKVLAEKKAAEEAAKVLAQKQEEELAAKVLADQQAADALASAKAAQDALDAAALKAAQEKMAADAKVLAEAKAAADAAAVKAAQEAADASAKAAAALQAAKDAAAAAAKAALLKKPALTLYSLSSKLTLSSYDNAYLQRYVRSLKNGASVTCLGYIYKKGTTLAKASALAKSQATAVCALMKKSNKTLKTSIILLDSSKAPKAAVGSKWVAVSYRIDGFKAQP